MKRFVERLKEMRIIGGKYRGYRLAPVSKGIRPSSDRLRETLFNVLGQSVVESTWLEAFAGSGAIGIEALSRGAVWADFVENNPKRCALLRQSLASMGFSNRSKVHCMKVERALTSLGKYYDLILMDPPYTIKPVHHVLEKLGDVAKDGALVAAGHSKHHPLQNSYGKLKLIREWKYGDTVCSIYREGGDN